MQASRRVELIMNLRTAMLSVPGSPELGTPVHIMGLVYQYPNTLKLREIRIFVPVLRSLLSLSLRQ